MLKGISRLLKKHKSSEVAKSRMQVLLSIDRQKTSMITEETINNIKEEIMGVISKYLKIDVTSFDVKLERNTDDSGRVLSTVVANIPIDI